MRVAEQIGTLLEPREFTSIPVLCTIIIYSEKDKTDI